MRIRTMTRLDSTVFDTADALPVGAEKVVREGQAPSACDGSADRPVSVRHLFRILAADGGLARDPWRAVDLIRPSLAAAHRNVLAEYLDGGAVDALKLGLSRL